jgi:hypothetical protein
MTMRRVATSRHHLADLLRRRPLLDPTRPPSDDPVQLERTRKTREMLGLPEPATSPQDRA